MKKKNILLFVFLFGILETVSWASSAVLDTSILDSISLLMIQLGVILFAAWLGGEISKKLGVSELLGEILMGAIISPYLVGSVPLPGFEYGIFPLMGAFPISLELYSFTMLASIALLFLVGLETDITTFFRFSLPGASIGIGGVIASFILGDLAAVMFSKYITGTAQNFLAPLPMFMGVISTATSVSITARILSDKKKIDTPEGATILSGAVIDDVLGIIVLTIVLSVLNVSHIKWITVLAISGKALAIWIVVTTLGLLLSRKISFLLKCFKDRDTIAIMSFSVALILSGVFEKSGLAMIIGAYIMGLSLSNTDIAFMIKERLSILRRFLFPIFFCVIGMLVNVKEMLLFPIFMTSIFYTIFAVLGKIIGCGLPTLFFNFNWRGALRVGVGMVPRGEVALIITGIGLATGILNEKTFTIAVAMTFFTTLLTPPILEKLLSQAGAGIEKASPIGRELRQVVYSLPTVETGDVVMAKVMDIFENDKFYVYPVSPEEKTYQIRKGNVFIVLKRNEKDIIFYCSEQDFSFVHTIFYEALAELAKYVKNIKTVTNTSNIVMRTVGMDTRPDMKYGKWVGAFHPAAVEVELKGKTKEEIIRELTALLVKSGQIGSTKEASVYNDVMERENNMSTGMQDEIALPHAKSGYVRKLVCAVGLKKEGIDFDAFDKNPSKIFVMTVAPKQADDMYLKFMAEVTKFLISKENRVKILSTKTNKELYDLFLTMIQ